jgi:iron complex outermembrane receptor protein
VKNIGLARGVALGTIAWCLGTPLYAQTAPASDEIIVTATRRADNLLNVPVSVTAVTAVAIERSGAKNLEDLARTVPGLAVQPSDEQSDKTFVIRGVGGGATAGGGVQSSTVAIYLDDTPITFGSSNPDLKLFDVQQVEVLRGPQGTLFGSSSMGGSIRYTSPQPSDHLTGMVRGEVSALAHGAPSYEGQAMVSGPLAGEALTFRASGFYRRDGGYIDLRDETTGGLLKKNYDTQKSYGGRIAVRAQVSPAFDVTLAAIYQKLDGDGISTFFTGRGVTNTLPLPPRSRVDRAPAYRNDKVFLPNLTINGDLGFAKLTSSSSYVKRKLNVYSDFSYYIQAALGLPDPTNFAAQNVEFRDFHAFVQEVRLASKGGGPFNWLIGGYFRDTHESSPQDVPSNLASVVPPLAPALLSNGSLYRRSLTTHRQQYAAFGELSYKVFDALTLTAGLRWTELKQTVDRTADGLFNGGFTSSTLRTDEKPVTPKFSAQYQIAPRAMVYATVAKGFREGGPNESVPAGLATCAAALHALGLTAAPASFNTDSVWSYEIGTKFETADRRLRPLIRSTGTASRR